MPETTLLLFIFLGALAACSDDASSDGGSAGGSAGAAGGAAGTSAGGSAGAGGGGAGAAGGAAGSSAGGGSAGTSGGEGGSGGGGPWDGVICAGNTDELHTKPENADCGMCLVTNCNSELSSAFGDGWQGGNYCDGTCAAYMQCHRDCEKQADPESVGTCKFTCTKDEACNLALQQWQQCGPMKCSQCY